MVSPVAFGEGVEPPRSVLQRVGRHAVSQTPGIWDDLGKNNLWKRMLKNVIATTLLVSICLIPGSKRAIGKAAYLGAITTVFGHPGRRFGQMTEALILVVAGSALGVAWSTFGVYLGSLVIEKNPPAAYAIRGVFLAVVTLFHGFLRSRTPRLFIFVLLMIIVSVVSLTSTAKMVTPVSVTQILYPILLAVACIIFINVCVFPEFSSSFLGQMTIDTLSDTAKTLEKAGAFFVEEGESASRTEKICHSENSKLDASDSGKSSEEGSKEAPKAHIYKRLMKFSRSWADPGHHSKRDDVNGTTDGNSHQPSIQDLTKSKAQIRKKLSDCKAAQQECNFELAVSVLPPRDLKPLSVTAMKRLVANTIAVVSACESKFALLGTAEDDVVSHGKSGDSNRREVQNGLHPLDGGRASTGHFDSANVVDQSVMEKEPTRELHQDKSELDLIKPKREIEFGDARLLRYLLRKVNAPYKNLHHVAARSIEMIMACIAFAYAVPTLPSGSQVPKGIIIEEIDVQIDELGKALLRFDADAMSTFEGAAAMREIEGLEPDIMPREEVFLMASFMLNVRQAVTHVEEMLKTSRELVHRRQLRHGRLRIYAPHIKWSKWLYSGGTEDEGIPTPARQANRDRKSTDDDDDDEDTSSMESNSMLTAKGDKKDVEKHAESNSTHGAKVRKETTKCEPRVSAQNAHPESEDLSWTLRLRGHAADAIEWMQTSEDLLYAAKLSVAVFLVLWPAFIASWNTWYSLNRGLWAALQLILITEVSIGTSVMTFLLRGIGTTLGCLWGYAALEARNGNRIVCAAMIFIGLFPCVYVQLGSQYPKAGMVCIVSICVVALSAELETVPGTPTDDYLKRWIAFLIGGSVALLVEVVLLPVKARTRLVESLTAAIRRMNEMERCIAFGIESGRKIDVFASSNIIRFERASSKANAALGAAEVTLPFCSTEPRIKGSFEGLALIYGEMIYVLHQIVDRMDNMLQLRTAYGSGPLEELNAEIYPYRRNVAGSITLTLFAIHSALKTKLPLPQYLPSARLAHLRMINRVREVVLQKVGEGQESQDIITKLARARTLRRKYMSWNAASAAQAEIIEYLEELIELTKLLVGANEFRSGLLTRSTYQDYAKKAEKTETEIDEDAGDEARDQFRDTVASEDTTVRRRRGTTMSSQAPAVGLTRRRRGTTLSSQSTVEDDVPASLRRIQSRKIEAGLKKQQTNEGWIQQTHL